MSKTLIFYKNILKGGLDEIFLKAVFKYFMPILIY